MENYPAGKELNQFILYANVVLFILSKAEISLHNTNAHIDRHTNIEAISFVKGI